MTMAHMTAQPRGFAAQRYRIVSEGEVLTELRFPLFGPSTATPLQGQVYRLRREGVRRNGFSLESASGEIVARAMPHVTGSRAFAVDIAGRRLALRPASRLRSDYTLFDGERAVGMLRPPGPLRRGVVADLPGDLPLEARVFLLWVALALWRRPRALGAG